MYGFDLIEATDDVVFSSLIFLFCFLPLCLVIYKYQIKNSARNIVLIVFSLMFYAWGEPVYVFLMLATVAANYFFAIGITRARKAWGQEDAQGICRVLLIGALVVDLGLLGLFKYSGFVIEGINQISGAHLTSPELVMPIGISFYTFQVITYIIDVYRGKVKAQKRFHLLLLYVSLFPQLVAGPIVKYGDIEEALTKRKVNFGLFCSGLERFIIGLAKKTIIANTMGLIATDLMSVEGLGTLSFAGAWLGVICFALQIYFDFSGYSDMAIGLGRMFGFQFLENFNYPYIARSASEFWRRWHISLGMFFRNYVYIPLGGNRHRLYLNLFIVWALTGLWHGASLNFVLWGLFWFTFIALEKRVFNSLLKRLPSLVSHIYLILLTLFGWVLFNFTDLSAAGQYYLAMFGAAPGGLVDPFTSLQFQNNLILIILAAIGCMPIARVANGLYERFCRHSRKFALCGFSARYVWLGLLLFFSTIMLVGNSYNPFIYFRF
jgi:alginate O-acetyltransferase complex protein AlgI